MHVLFVTYGLPAPPRTGARVHDFNLIREVSKQCEVSLISLQERTEATADAARALPFCQRVVTIAAAREEWPSLDHLWSGLKSRWPLATWPYYSPELVARLGEEVAQAQPDIVQIEHSFLAPYIDAVTARARVRTVLSFHNVAERQYRSMIHVWPSPAGKLLGVFKWLAMRGWESRQANRFDHVLCVSRPDRDSLRAAGVRPPVSVIANGVDCQRLAPLPTANSAAELLFVGTMGYPPNVDAVRYFFRTGWPRVRALVGDARLTIAGHGGRESFADLLGQPGVEVTGSVADLLPYYRRAQVVVVPLRAGGGTRLKILEAMALARPVVSTTTGCAGLDVIGGEHLLVADDPTLFAQSVVRLLQDEPLRARLSAAARRHVEAHYDWSRIGSCLVAVYRSLIEGPAAGVSSMARSALHRWGLPSPTGAGYGGGRRP